MARRWGLLVGAVIVGLVVFRAVENERMPSGAAPASPHPPATPASVTDLGHPLLGVTAGWELFARGNEVVVRIEFARGRITRTDVPALASSGPVYFLAGPRQVIIRPLDFVPGYVVPDHGDARELPGVLNDHGPVLPGPDPRHVWLQDETILRLVGLDGRPTDVTMPFPYEHGFAEPDGAGYAFYDEGGLYDLRPTGTRRIADGTPLAVGPTGWLIDECAARNRCVAIAVDRARGSRHVLPGFSSGGEAWSGAISPDGRTAALYRTDGKPAVVHLLNLRSGVERRLGIQVTGDPQALAWSPDCRWLFVAGANGGLHAVDARTGAVHGLGAALPPVSQLAIRP